MVFQKPYKMVVIDDQPNLIDILVEYIEDLFPRVFAIECFTSPVAALEYIQSNPVLVVITDVAMPDIGGDHLNLKIKQLCKGVQTIILTGMSSYMASITCFRDGANGFIAKPFELEEIELTIQNVLNKMLAQSRFFRAGSSEHT